MTPLYGFLRGDTIGLLVLAHEEDTMRDLAAKLASAATVRVRPPRRPRVLFRGEALDDESTVARAGMAPLDRFDVIDEEG